MVYASVLFLLNSCAHLIDPEAPYSVHLEIELDGGVGVRSNNVAAGDSWDFDCLDDLEVALKGLKA